MRPGVRGDVAPSRADPAGRSSRRTTMMPILQKREVGRHTPQHCSVLSSGRPVDFREFEPYLRGQFSRNSMAQAQVPVTVLTGYLGAGKTTLLNRILSEQHGRKYAVVSNEFGELGVDNDLVVDADEEVFEMNNGCICCTVRGDLIRVIGGLMKRSARLDGLSIETSGLADPAPVAQTFLVDEEVKARTKLDAIVTVVDAKHVLDHLGDGHEIVEQIAFADIIVLNKLDLVDEARRGEVEARIRSIN